jgi:hypothetical protein
MVSILLIQGFHTIEHLVQVFQRFVFFQPKGAGVLGSWVDVEPVHLGYNMVFLWLLALTIWEGKFWKEFKVNRLFFWAITISVVWQGWHFTEHLFKMAQFIDTGNNGTPGLLGNKGVFGTGWNIVWLHFSYNFAVYVPFVVAFFAGGFHREMMNEIRKLTGRRRKPQTSDAAA